MKKKNLYCAARNYQGLLHLQIGSSQYCCHTGIHPSELNAENPSSLLNTLYTKTQRKRLAEGHFPRDCRYCEIVEKNKENTLSERQLRNQETWAPKIDNQELEYSKNFKNFEPRSLQVSFTNHCNFKCVYCSPKFSSKWYSDIKNSGNYEVASEKRDYAAIYSKFDIFNKNSNNPYLNQFWKWFPNLLNSLKILRLSGGEPFLDQNTDKIIDHILSNDTLVSPLEEFSVTTNFGMDFEIIDKKLKKLELLLEQNKVNRVHLYLSLDSFDMRSEYIRNGLDLNLFKRNLKNLLENYTKISLSFICTYSIFSVSTFSSFLKEYTHLKSNFCLTKKRYKGFERIQVDFPLLVRPDFLSPLILEDFLMDKTIEDLSFIKNHPEVFSSTEQEKFARILRLRENSELNSDQIKFQKKMFKSFILEYDRRSKTDFNQIFPELSDFFTSI